MMNFHKYNNHQKGKELYILLSYFCNFKCSHCLNSSSSDRKDSLISPKETDAIIEVINNNEEIKRVHFSGGEPTLHLDIIESIQTKIKRKVNYSMTTNAWFGKKINSVLNRIKIDEMIISYDKFHDPFITQETLESAIKDSIKKGIKVTINYLYENLSDLAKAEPLKKYGTQIRPGTLTTSGRFKKNPTDPFCDKNLFNSTCPSVEERSNSLEKIIYIPTKGYTPCCGPLVFDGLAEDQFLFSKNYSDYKKNLLRSKLIESGFSQQNDKIELIEKRCIDRCSTCKFIYGKHQKNNIPSKHNIIHQKKFPLLYKTKEELDYSDTKALHKNFNIAYILLGKREELLNNELQELTCPQIEMVSLFEENHSDFIKLYEKIYLKQYPEYINELEGKRKVEGFYKYFEICHHKYIFKKNNITVGAFLMNTFNPHPYFNSPTSHIGFIGYDKDDLSLDEGRWIKAKIKELISIEKNTLISSTVYSFNQYSLKFHLKLGFEISLLRIEEKK